jgi:hypothetical protein
MNGLTGYRNQGCGGGHRMLHRLETRHHPSRTGRTQAQTLEPVRHLSTGHRRRPHSPAHRVTKQWRLPRNRRALTTPELTAMNIAARTSGNDPVLDALLLRFHSEGMGSHSGISRG